MVAGKGGVGKTTVTAVIARAASRQGLRVLVVELDGKPTLAELVPDLEVMAISAPDALDEYLRDNGFARIAKRLNRTGVIDMVGTAAPGIDDIVVLGKIKQLERSGAYDLIVVDGPAAGHAITFLTAAAGLADSVRSGPVRAQADDVLDLLHDAQRCQVVLVTLAETTPVNEVIETAFALEDQVGVQLGPVVVNGVDVGVDLPDEAAVAACVGSLDASTAAALTEAAAFRRSRRTMEAQEIGRLTEQLPISQVLLPAKLVAGLTSADAAVRYWSATGIGNIGMEAASARAAVAQTLQDPSPSVRIAAARAAARLGDTDQALEVLRRELESEHQWGRLAAAIVLDEMDQQANAAIDSLKGALNNQPNKYIVRVANRAINELQGTNHQVP